MIDIATDNVMEKYELEINSANELDLPGITEIDDNDDNVSIPPIEFSWNDKTKVIPVSKLTKTHIGTIVKLPTKDLKRVSNVRNSNKENNPKLTANIKLNGIQDPLHVNPNGDVVDGYCRWNSALELSLEEVPALIVNVAKKDIPAYQISRTIREDLDNTEIQRAILQHLVSNPSDSDAEVAKKLDVSRVTVHTARSIISFNPDLQQKVLEDVISQKAVLGAIQAIRKEAQNKGFTAEDTDAEIREMTSDLMNALEIAKEEHEEKSKKKPDAKPFKWNTPQVKKFLKTEYDLDVVDELVEKPEAKSSFSPIKTLHEIIVQNAEANVNSEGTVTLTATIGKDVYADLLVWIKERQEKSVKSTTAKDESDDFLGDDEPKAKKVKTPKTPKEPKEKKAKKASKASVEIAPIEGLNITDADLEGLDLTSDLPSMDVEIESNTEENNLVIEDDSDFDWKKELSAVKFSELEELGELDEDDEDLDDEE
jgi:ParB-like chromosome segregation protein Spo0J